MYNRSLFLNLRSKVVQSNERTYLDIVSPFGYIVQSHHNEMSPKKWWIFSLNPTINLNNILTLTKKRLPYLLILDLQDFVKILTYTKIKWVETWRYEKHYRKFSYRFPLKCNTHRLRCSTIPLLENFTVIIKYFFYKNTVLRLVLQCVTTLL